MPHPPPREHVFERRLARPQVPDLHADAPRLIADAALVVAGRPDRSGHEDAHDVFVGLVALESRRRSSLR
jgi:hypothetical protein